MTFLDRANLRWRLRLGCYVIIAAGVGMYVNLGAMTGRVPDWHLWLDLAFPPLALAAGAWMAVTIRCPSCGENVFWKAIHEQRLHGSLGSFLTLQECPNCGSDGSPDWQNPPGYQANRARSRLSSLRLYD